MSFIHYPFFEYTPLPGGECGRSYHLHDLWREALSNSVKKARECRSRTTANGQYAVVDTLQRSLQYVCAELMMKSRYLLRFMEARSRQDCVVDCDSVRFYPAKNNFTSLCPFGCISEFSIELPGKKVTLFHVSSSRWRTPCPQ